jgi:hypothetical protein
MALRGGSDPGRRHEANMGQGARDDAAAMQFPIPGWTYDNKRFCPDR